MSRAALVSAGLARGCRMPDETANLVLEHLRVMRAKLDDIAADITELKQRMGLLGGQVAHLFGQYAILSNRVDRIDARLERIGRRLDLVDA
ncbi:MAG TPA: hypothetical protein VGM07_15290 [Stellaceae bacterium]|jgi:hypothetical protein